MPTPTRHLAALALLTLPLLLLAGDALACQSSAKPYTIIDRQHIYHFMLLPWLLSPKTLAYLYISMSPSLAALILISDSRERRTINAKSMAIFALTTLTYIFLCLLLTLSEHPANSFYGEVFKGTPAFCGFPSATYSALALMSGPLAALLYQPILGAFIAAWCVIAHTKLPRIHGVLPRIGVWLVASPLLFALLSLPFLLLIDLLVGPWQIHTIYDMTKPLDLKF